MKLRTAQKGFTLIELLVVIGILALLFSIVLVAINPTKQFNQANDTKRRSDTLTILNAIDQYAADHTGSFPATITTPLAVINISKAGADLCSALIPTYISALPQDPKFNAGAGITNCAAYDTNYQISVDASGRITVSAPNAAYPTISATR